MREKINMNLKVKFFPPYRKKGDAGEHQLQIDRQSLTIEELADHMSNQWQDLLDFPLIDSRGHLTAEFMVNGKHVSLQHTLQDGDLVSVIPYLCGG